MVESVHDLPIETADRPYVPVQVNGAGPHTFLLDTGALGLSLSADLAQALGLESDGWVTLRSLAIGAATWNEVGAGTGDNAPLSAALGRRVDGILGSRFLAWARLRVTIDYPGGTLSLKESDGSAESRPAGVPLRIAGDYPLAPVCVQGAGPYLFLVDTGASRCMVSPEVAQSLGLPSGPAAVAGGVALDIPCRRSTIPRLSVGDLSAADVEALVMDCSGVSDNAGVRVDGYLGHNLLSRFRLTLDYPRQVLALR